MITRLRSRFPATCSRFGGVEGEYILSMERIQGRYYTSTQRGRSRVSELGGRDERGGFKDEGESRSRRRVPLLYGKVAWGVDARIHTHIYTCAYTSRRGRATVCVERFRVGVIRIRNLFLPRGSTTTSSYILPIPVLSLPNSGQMHEPLPSSPRIKSDVKCSAGSYVIFQGFIALFRVPVVG